MTDPYYPFYPGDYQRVTSGLTLIEHGAYRVLLDEYYSTGPLPVDFDRLFRITRAMSDEEKEAVKNVIKSYFHNKNGNYHNTKADNIIEKRDSFLKSQSEKSAKGVAARKKPVGKPVGKPGGQPLPSPSPSPSLSSTPSLKKAALNANSPDKEQVKEASIPQVLKYIDEMSEKLHEAGLFDKVFEFKDNMIGDKKNPRSILHTLCRCMVAKPESPWAYCEKIISVEDGNFNEKDNTRV